VIIGNDNSINAELKRRTASVKITGKIISRSKVEGKLITSKLSTGKSSTQNFKLSIDSSPKMTKEDLIRKYQQRQKEDRKWLIPKDSAKGKRMREMIKKQAEAENVAIYFKGVVINHKNEPVPDIRLKIYTRRYDPDGNMGMTSDTQYVTTGINGDFKVSKLTGYLLNITCHSQKGYQATSRLIRGKKSLKATRNNAITLKLKSETKGNK
jgi:hypothetical protein